MPNKYGRIIYEADVKYFYTKTFQDDKLIQMVGPSESRYQAELAFHMFIPDGYIIPDWLGV